MKRIILTLLIAFPAMLSIAQSDYYSTDSTVVVGVTVIDQGAFLNARVCIVEKPNQKLEFTPYEISEYKTQGKVYVSKEIEKNGEQRKFFLERLVDGNVSLYYFRAKGGRIYYFQEEGKELTALPRRLSTNGKQSYKEILSNELQNCTHTPQHLRIARYNKRALAGFFNKYSSCSPLPFSVTRYGIIAGYGSFVHSVPGYSSETLVRNFNFRYHPQYVVGAYIDKPLYRNAVSLYMALTISEHAESGFVRYDDTDLDILTNSVNLQLPLMIRYRLHTHALTPFVSAGGIIGHDLYNNTRVFQTHFEQEVITTNLVPHNIPEVNPFVGFTAGAGMEYRLNFRNRISIEVQYLNMLPMGSNKTKTILLGRSGFQLLTGINF
ncbi:MAG: hypothetical protein EA361_16405 [Bacteroidetes bacterium]|nr:MAG: hypothetical protein EA361_16405 [Bacteroidota bacterium]